MSKRTGPRTGPHSTPPATDSRGFNPLNTIHWGWLFKQSLKHLVICPVRLWCPNLDAKVCSSEAPGLCSAACLLHSHQNHKQLVVSTAKAAVDWTSLTNSSLFVTGSGDCYPAFGHVPSVLRSFPQHNPDTFWTCCIPLSRPSSWSQRG